MLEKHRDFLRDFRGDTVHPSTLRLLDDLGLGERFAALPQRKLERMRMLIGESTVVAADFGRLRGRRNYIAMVPQWDFLDLLAKAAADEPSFTLRMCTEVTGLRSEGGRVTGVRYLDEDGSPGELAADLTVGCDGRDSVVRRSAGMRSRAFDIPMDVWSVRVRAVPGSGAGGQVFARFADGQVAVTMDRGDYFQTSYLIRKGDDARLRARGIEWFRGALAELFGWAPHVLEEIGSFDDVKLLETSMDRLPRWYADGVLCIGDAAHTMSPVGGVGVNLAVQDAAATARLLAEPLLRGTIGVADLARVQRRRLLPTAVAQRLQLGEHEMLLRPALEGTLGTKRLPFPMRLLRRFPALGAVTAYVGGVGVRPERAPGFARRARR